MTELPRHPKFNLLTKSGCSAQYGRTRLLQVLAEGQLWQETLQLSDSPHLEQTDTVLSQVPWLLAVGRAHFHLGHQQEVSSIRCQLNDMLGQQQTARERRGEVAAVEAGEAQKEPKEIEEAVKKARRELDGEIQEIEQGLKQLNAYDFALQGKLTEALRDLESSNDRDPVLQARWQAQSGDPEKALETLREHVKSHEQETLPLAHLAALQWDLGQTDAAGETIRQLRELSANLDLQAPPFSRLTPLAMHLGWPRDWRIEASTRDDVGQRPTLDSLGPLRWQPTNAPEWTLSDAEQNSVSLSDYRGRAVVVIFYLGYGCLHCAEQLHAFGPKVSEFQAAGIDVVAISSDDAEGLKNSLEAFDGAIPIPLLADPQLHVFRQFRVFDDFENQPLHGTFLIDSDGRIRWQDISYEPFMDPEFVLTEGRRLLSSDVVGNPLTNLDADATLPNTSLGCTDSPFPP